MNRGKPSNSGSRAAKAHIGKALFCTRTPPNPGENEIISTHYQRAHIKGIKHHIFNNKLNSRSIYISMDDKAYLRPGTDVGCRVVRNKKLYDITEESQRKLPQHDFCVPDLYQTPSSFRLIRGHLQCIDGSEKLINDFDQTLVMIRPKAYVGSSVALRWSLPQMFEESSIVQQRYSVCFRILKVGCMIFYSVSWMSLTKLIYVV